MYSFGSGVLIGTRTDIPNATPVNFGLVQEVTIDETATIKELYGQFQHPVAIARGTIKTTGKAKVARISGLAFANLFYGVTPAPGQLATSFAEAGAVPAASTFTVTPANSANLVDDAGVVYAGTGLPLTKMPAAATLAAMSSGLASFLSFRWPHFLGSTWSSICTPAAPESSNARTMCITLSASPYPVSPSTMTGS